MSKAVVELQRLLNRNATKLLDDGDLGPKTKGAIDNLNIPLWLKIAMKEIGTREIKGYKHNARVIEYHSVSGGFTTDEVPWCGSFVNWVLRKSGITTTVPYPARALSWLKFGILGKPTIGAIAVKSRVGGGHVGFVVAVEGNYVFILGGNQSDEVNIRKYLISDFKEYRVPKDYVSTKYMKLIPTNAAVGTQES